MYKSGGIPGTQASRNEDLQGFVLGVLRTETIVRQSLPETDPDRAVEVYVLDVSAPPGSQLLYPKGATINSKDDLNLSASLSRIIPVADREWKVFIVSGAGSFGHGRLPWAVLLGGLLYTVGLSAYLLASLIQSIRIRDSEDKFRNLIEGSIQGMWLHRDFELLFVNQVLAQEHEIHVALVDIVLPGPDGLTLLSRLKETDSPTVVVVMTAEGTIDTAVDAMRREAFHYNTKPLRLQELAACRAKSRREIQPIAGKFGAKREIAARKGGPAKWCDSAIP